MKVWVVTCEYGYNFDEMESIYVIGTFSNLAYAARAAICSFFSESDEPIDCITTIYSNPTNTYHRFYGLDKENNYSSVVIQRTTLDDFYF